MPNSKDTLRQPPALLVKLDDHLNEPERLREAVASAWKSSVDIIKSYNPLSDVDMIDLIQSLRGEGNAKIGRHASWALQILQHSGAINGKGRGILVDVPVRVGVFMPVLFYGCTPMNGDEKTISPGYGLAVSVWGQDHGFVLSGGKDTVVVSNADHVEGGMFTTVVPDWARDITANQATELAGLTTFVNSGITDKYLTPVSLNSGMNGFKLGIM